MKRFKKYQVFVWIIALVAMIVGIYNVEQGATGQEIETVPKPSKAETVTGPKTVDVYLKRTFVNGRTNVEVVPTTIVSMQDFWARYKDWELVSQDFSKVVFQKKVSDISPLLKVSGYFGLSKDNILTIYDGNPEDQKVIQSFFRIDVKELESHLQKQLLEGIPVQSKAHYEKVMKQLEDHAKKK